VSDFMDCAVKAAYKIQPFVVSRCGDKCSDHLAGSRPRRWIAAVTQQQLDLNLHSRGKISVYDYIINYIAVVIQVSLSTANTIFSFPTSLSSQIRTPLLRSIPLPR
jgi:hypothetical protein